MRYVYVALLVVMVDSMPGGAVRAGASEEGQTSMRPKVIFFDVNETLLDLSAMRASVGRALGGREELLPLWFSTMLHHSLVESATGRYHDFGTVGTAALMMVASSNGIELSEEEARTSIVTPLLSLPPHPDVRDSLQALKDRGYTLASLTNSSNQGVETQFENANLTDLFTRRFSVEDVKIYKPNPEPYLWAAEQMNIAPEDGLMVAAHGWDVAGAKAAGMQAIFVRRPGQVLYPLGIAPDHVVGDLEELVTLLSRDR